MESIMDQLTSTLPKALKAKRDAEDRVAEAKADLDKTKRQLERKLAAITEQFPVIIRSLNEEEPLQVEEWHREAQGGSDYCRWEKTKAATSFTAVTISIGKRDGQPTFQFDGLANVGRYEGGEESHRSWPRVVIPTAEIAEFAITRLNK